MRHVVSAPDVARSDDEGGGQHDGSRPHSDALEDLEPLCSEEEFAEEVRDLVAAEAPELFALVEEHGERVNGWVVAWGMAFDDRVEVVSVRGSLHLSLPSIDRAHRAFSRRRKIRLVRTDSGTTLRPEQVG